MPTRTPHADDDPARPPQEPAGTEPLSPKIPSLASLRDPRRRTAVDVLVPAAAGPVAPPRPRDPPRPPEWADLWHLGLHVTRTLASVPGRVAGWQLRCLRTLLGR